MSRRPDILHTSLPQQKGEAYLSGFSLTLRWIHETIKIHIKGLAPRADNTGTRPTETKGDTVDKSEYTRPPVSGQRQPSQSGLTHISISTIALIVSAARESFDANTLRHLAIEFGRLADEKDGGL